MTASWTNQMTCCIVGIHFDSSRSYEIYSNWSKSELQCRPPEPAPAPTGAKGGEYPTGNNAIVGLQLKWKFSVFCEQQDSQAAQALIY